MKIHPIIAHNPLQNIFYVLEYGDKNALIIDPCDSKLAQKLLDEHDLKLQKIFITHEHYDHYQWVEWLDCRDIYAGKIATENMPIFVSHIFQDWDIIFEADGISIKAIFTPWHADWHMMFELSENNTITAIFSWDALFQGWVGHTRNGSSEDLYNSVSKFEKYSDEVMIYSGHDYLDNNSRFIREYVPEKSMQLDTVLWERCEKPYFTTLGQEREYNPFLTVCKQEFIRLRELRNNF